MKSVAMLLASAVILVLAHALLCFGSFKTAVILMLTAIYILILAVYTNFCERSKTLE